MQLTKAIMEIVSYTWHKIFLFSQKLTLNLNCQFFNKFKYFFLNIYLSKNVVECYLIITNIYFKVSIDIWALRCYFDQKRLRSHREGHLGLHQEGVPHVALHHRQELRQLPDTRDQALHQVLILVIRDFDFNMRTGQFCEWRKDISWLPDMLYSPLVEWSPSRGGRRGRRRRRRQRRQRPRPRRPCRRGRPRPRAEVEGPAAAAPTTAWGVDSTPLG